MKKDLEILKEKYGESFVRFARQHLATLLEYPGVLPKMLEEKFAPNHFLAEDIINNGYTNSFVNYLFALFYERIDKKDVESVQDLVIESPEVLMDKAGYKLYKCETASDVDKFKKYYRSDEEICTFRDPSRIDNNLIFFAVRKDVDNIKREDFDKPSKDDDYSKSVLSIQFLKDENSRVSIISRYNHTVDNPNATCSNNLNNIISGLSKSFEKYYNIKLINGAGNFDVPGYVFAGDGKYYPYNTEVFNEYYCPGNIIVSGNDVIRLDKSEYEVFDYFIFNKVKRKFQNVAKDSFVDGVEDIKKIETFVDKQTKERTLKITYKDTETKETKYFIVTTNERGQLIKAYVENEPKTNDSYLMRAKNLKWIKAPNVKYLPYASFGSAKKLEHVEMDNVESIGSNSFTSLNEIKELSFPKCKKISQGSFTETESLEGLDLPLVSDISIECFYNAGNLKILNVPQVVSIGGYCFCKNNIEELILLNAERIGQSSFANSNSLKNLYAPKLTYLGNGSFKDVESLNELDIHNVKALPGNNFTKINQIKVLNLENCTEIGNKCCMHVEGLIELFVPEVKSFGRGCFFKATSLKELDLANCKTIELESFKNVGIKTLFAPMLQNCEGYNFTNADNMITCYTPSLIGLGNRCFTNVNMLKELNISNMTHAGNECFQNANNIKAIKAPCLKKLNLRCFQNAEKLKKVVAEVLWGLDMECFKNCENLQVLIAPSLINVGMLSFDESLSIKLAIVNPRCDFNPPIEHSQNLLKIDKYDMNYKSEVEKAVDDVEME